jgi:UDP-N-acetyl-D-mannosaminuronic acid dehydrogenase
MALAITQALKARLPSRLMVVEPNIDELPVSLEGAKFASIDAALAEADILVLLVDHKAFKKVDAERLAGRHLVDTRGVWTGQNRRRSDVQLARESFEPAEACPGQ